MKQSKIGMIGCGMISEVYAKNITERFGDLQLVACADLRMEAAQARAWRQRRPAPNSLVPKP